MSYAFTSRFWMYLERCKSVQGGRLAQNVYSLKTPVLINSFL